ncbi:MAG: hypothetical protein OJF59_001012 [Cytophagales bacterium]|nr:MAG: hypothetical protein OJF59_001012 [Cytophagales bacterium]
MKTRHLKKELSNFIMAQLLNFARHTYLQNPRSKDCLKYLVSLNKFRMHPA